MKNLRRYIGYFIIGFSLARLVFSSLSAIRATSTVPPPYLKPINLCLKERQELGTLRLNPQPPCTPEAAK